MARMSQNGWMKMWLVLWGFAVAMADMDFEELTRQMKMGDMSGFGGLGGGAGGFDDSSHPSLQVTEEDEKVMGKLENEEDLKVETHKYQTEVDRLMDIIINSLYTDKEVFLRELISNASDALEKVRFMAVSDKDILNVRPNLDIRIHTDNENQTITIHDTGIGMTKEDLMTNLGTVAKSGTTNFLEAMAKGGNDVNLIGQFGVGFYAAFLVADKVTVISKHPKGKQTIWQSKADGTFSVAEDPRGDTLGRGTQIVLHLKEDASQYLKETALKELAKKYSQFIDYPIYVKTITKKTEEVVDEEATAKAAEEAEKKKTEEEDEKKEEHEGEEVEEGKEKEDTPPSPIMKKVDVEVKEWKQVNPQKPLWLRPKEEIEPKEYDEFYKSFSKDYSAPLAYVHFSGEGELEFKALAFVPARAPSDLFQNYFAKAHGMKLYVRRVLVAEKFEDLLPNYLHFVTGVVDADDLPLNVSREQLQQQKLLKVVSKKIVRKILEKIKKLSDESDEEYEKQKTIAEDESKSEEEKKDAKKAMGTKTTFSKFYEQFSKNLKLGCYEDESNRAKIAPVLRFKSLKHQDRPISLQHYIDAMPEEQPHIFFLSGLDIAHVKNMAVLKVFAKKNYDVLFLLESMDEPCLSQLKEFKDKTFKAVMDKDVNLPETPEEAKRVKALNKKYSDLLAWLKKTVDVSEAIISKRLIDEPSTVVSASSMYSPHMEKVMKSQTFSNPDQLKYMLGKKVLEINANHPLIIKLNKLVGDSSESEEAKTIAKGLYYTGLINGGFDIDNTASLKDHMNSVLYKMVDLGPVASELEDVSVEEVSEEEEEEEDKKDKENEAGESDEDDDEPAHDEL